MDENKVKNTSVDTVVPIYNGENVATEMVDGIDNSCTAWCEEYTASEEHEPSSSELDASGAELDKLGDPEALKVGDAVPTTKQCELGIYAKGTVGFVSSVPAIVMLIITIISVYFTVHTYIMLINANGPYGMGALIVHIIMAAVSFVLAIISGFLSLITGRVLKERLLTYAGVGAFVYAAVDVASFFLLCFIRVFLIS